MYRENAPDPDIAIKLAKAQQRIAYRYSWARWFLRMFRLVLRKVKVSTPNTVVTLQFYTNNESSVTIKVLRKGTEWYHHTDRGVMGLDSYSTWVSNKGDKASLSMAGTLAAFAKAKYLSSKFRGGK